MTFYFILSKFEVLALFVHQFSFSISWFEFSCLIFFPIILSFYFISLYTTFIHLGIQKKIT